MLAKDSETASFADSAMFDRTFDEGMALVEETARYLDGKGREEARVLPRKAAMLYAGESMRVTTRLMQAASWLLVQRAVHDGDMPAEDATNERYRLGSKDICLGGGGEGIVNRLLGAFEIAEEADQRGEHAARVGAVDRFHFRADRCVRLVAHRRIFRGGIS